MCLPDILLLSPLLQFEGSPGSVEDTFCLSFSLETERFGQRQVVELISNGGNIAVTEDNRLEWVTTWARFICSI